MATEGKKTRQSSAAGEVRARVQSDGARYWKHGDFDGLSPAAVATELSRLARQGQLQRVGKGVYYRAVPTSFGLSVPGATAAAAATLRTTVHPAGLTAANALGLSTQNPMRPQFATPAAKPPTALRDAIVHTGRPSSRSELTAEEGALLEVLRERAKSSDLSAGETIRRLEQTISAKPTYARLASAALSEPPRVRAILGALGQSAGMSPTLLTPLRESLNPLSRFDFGPLRALRHADEWQAK